MMEQLLLPQPYPTCLEGYEAADELYIKLTHEWLNSRLEKTLQVWSSPSAEIKTEFSNARELADDILTILTHRTFNFQSKARIQPLLPDVRHTLLRQINNGAPISLFLLYNGGYRASSFPDSLSLVFEPDQTESMLLFQVGQLQEQIAAVYPPGIDFHIVVNNGVAFWVNDIPLWATQQYTDRLRHMINYLGASDHVHVLLQSEGEGFDPKPSFDPCPPHAGLLEKEHEIVERFLGRKCNYEEAMHRSALYLRAEAKWGKDLRPIISAKDGLILRQVAHPDMLSFRPFPGGAIRIQNGSLGFQYQGDRLRPKLITAETVRQYGIKYVPYRFPWNENEHTPTQDHPSDAY
jgi:hypothetical protein